MLKITIECVGCNESTYEVDIPDNVHSKSIARVLLSTVRSEGWMPSGARFICPNCIDKGISNG